MTTLRAAGTARGAMAGGLEQAGHDIAPRLLLALAAGRTVFRVILYVVNFAGLVAWSSIEFDHYAAACGALAWCIAVVQTGPEKAALTLLPRARRSRAALVAGVLLVVRVLTWASGMVALAVALAAPDAAVTIYVAVFAQLVALGLNVVAVAVQRALGRAHRDVANFAALSAGWLALAGLALAGVLGPVPYVLGQFLLAAVATELVSRGTRRSLPAFRASGSVRRVLARTAALMGVYDTCLMLTTSAVFAALLLTDQARESGELYLVVAGWGAVTAGFIYVLRVYQPRTSLRLAAAGGAHGRERARRAVGRSLPAGALWLLAAAGVIWAFDLDSLTEGTSLVVWLLVLLASRLPVFGLLAYGVYVLENSDARSLRLAAVGAAWGLAATVVTAAAAVPVAGSVGAVWALAAGEVAQAAVLRLSLGRAW